VSIKQIAIVLMLALVAGSLTLPIAHAATTYEVEVGRFFDPLDPSGESLRFYPADLQLHQGDVVHFSSVSVHGVSLLPDGIDASDWLPRYAGGVDRAFSLLGSDADEGAGAYKVNLRVFSPSQPCGWPTQEACSFDGSDPGQIGGVLHSGLSVFPEIGGGLARQLSFSVEINSDPGTNLDVVDVLNPGMRMRIEVVPAGAPASDPAELDEESAALFALDAEQAASLHNQYKGKKVKKTVRGKTTWKAWVGVEIGTVSLRKMYPSKLTIKEGDRVKWLFNKNIYSAHTVTFPMAGGRSIADDFPVIACDPDGDAIDPTGEHDPEPDTQPTSSDPPFCDSVLELEMDVPARVPPKTGDGKITGQKDRASSGFRGRGFAPSVAAYTLTFTKASRSGYSYVDMVSRVLGISATGKIVVKKP
jgi:plastocyanin